MEKRRNAKFRTVLRTRSFLYRKYDLEKRNRNTIEDVITIRHLLHKVYNRYDARKFLEYPVLVVLILYFLYLMYTYRCTSINDIYCAHFSLIFLFCTSLSHSLPLSLFFTLFQLNLLRNPGNTQWISFRKSQLEQIISLLNNVLFVMEIIVFEIVLRWSYFFLARNFVHNFLVLVGCSWKLCNATNFKLWGQKCQLNRLSNLYKRITFIRPRKKRGTHWI